MENTDAKEKWVEEKFSSLSLEQKVGQLMVFGAAGAVPTPHVEKMITKYHVGGLRIAQKFFHGSAESRSGEEAPYPAYDKDTFDRSVCFGTKRVYCTPREYAETLNFYRRLAMERKGGVPLHFAYDQEGEGSDFLFGQRFFPYPMGIAASGDVSLSYKTAYLSGLQAHALGANMIHSPVTDVNTNAKNPEIGCRSYSDDPSVVARFAAAAVKGYRDAGIIATAKHFPGRGASDSDAHAGLPTINLSLDELMETHIAPYRNLIKEGLPAIMAAFTNYTAFGGDKLPAAANPEIINGFLRKELGFNGVVTTDNVQMKGLLERFELSEAVIRCLNAGCDLVLYRGEAPSCIYIINKVVEAVKNGDYKEEQLDVSVRRILKMRYDMNLSDGGFVDPEAADTYNMPLIEAAEKEAAEKTVTLLRNNGLLPIKKEQKILLIEQAHHFHEFINTVDSHPGLLYEEMRKISDNVSLCLIKESYTEDDRLAVLNRVRTGDFDAVVSTGYYNYRSHACMKNLLKDIFELTDKVAVVANTPYTEFALPDFVENAVVCFCPSVRAEMKAVAETLFGLRRPSAWPKVKVL